MSIKKPAKKDGKIKEVKETKTRVLLMRKYQDSLLKA